MKKIKDEQLARISSLSELKAMRCRIDRQTSQLERRMRNNLTKAGDMYSYMETAKTAFTVIDKIQSFFRYVKKGNYES